MCPSPWALPEPGLPMETADERRDKEAIRTDEGVVAASEVRRLEERVRDLERLLGRKTMEVEILKEALDLLNLQGKKTDLAAAIAPSGGYPVKRIAETLGGPAPTWLSERVASVQSAVPSRAGHDPVNAKRVYRLMKKSSLLPA